MSTNITDDPLLFKSLRYDIIIVGGGTAGLCLASRLSEDPNLTIGVLEAGPDLSSDPEIAAAGPWGSTAHNPAYSWGFKDKERSLSDGRKVAIDVTRGKLLGGSSAINGMVWRQAPKSEYDAIAALGNPGWAFEDLVPYFKKAQCHYPQVNTILHTDGNISTNEGSDGVIKTSYSDWYSSLIPPYAEALSALSLEINGDPSNGNVNGLSNTARSVDPATKMRQFASAYLHQTTGRKNISVLVGAQATKILFSHTDPSLAVGVKFVVGQDEYEVEASKEIILSAGAYKTPQLLELSGIGDVSILSKYGIEINASIGDCPGVGKNLQDHLSIFNFLELTPEASSALTWLPANPNVVSEAGQDIGALITGNPYLFTSLQTLISDSDREGLAAMLRSYEDSNDATALERAQFRIQRQWLEIPGSTASDVEFIFSKTFPHESGRAKLFLPGVHLHPASRGTVHIASADPLDAPSIDHKYLDRNYDIQSLIYVSRFAQKIARTEPFASLIAGSIAPPPVILETNDQLSEYIKANAATVYHPVGSCAMVPRELGGVVDPQLKVYGSNNLRVVDASIIPLQIGTHPMATVYAIAEKAADIIKTTHRLT